LKQDANTECLNIYEAETLLRTALVAGQKREEKKKKAEEGMALPERAITIHCNLFQCIQAIRKANGAA
jgi:hypothetical protein